MFRAINEKLRDLNTALGSISESFVIACECADVTCIQTISIDPESYERIRSHPNRFAVRLGHVYHDVEDVVAEDDGFAIVENRLDAALAVETDPRGPSADLAIEQDPRS